MRYFGLPRISILRLVDERKVYLRRLRSVSRDSTFYNDLRSLLGAYWPSETIPLILPKHRWYISTRRSRLLVSMMQISLHRNIAMRSYRKNILFSRLIHELLELSKNCSLVIEFLCKDVPQMRCLYKLIPWPKTVSSVDYSYIQICEDYVSSVNLHVKIRYENLSTIFSWNIVLSSTAIRN